MSGVRRRALGTTGLSVSEIGFGAWGIGGRTAGLTSYGDTDDATSLAALARAVERGITFFDTSSAYGDGHSETLLGQALAPVRDRVVIGTKAGFARFDTPPDYSPDHLAASLEASLRRLRTDHVDLLMLHDPPPALLDARPEIVEALRRFRDAGKIRAFGISVKAPRDALEAVPRHGFQVVQLNLNMLDTRAIADGVLDMAARHGVGIIARTPLCFGFLSGTITTETRFPAGDHRNRWPPAQIQRWIDGASHALAFAGTDAPPPHQALRFCLSFPAVSVVIPGMLSPAEVEANAAASALGALPAQAVDDIVDMNRRINFFA